MSAATRRPEITPASQRVNADETQCERDRAADQQLRHRHSSIFGEEPRNETGNRALRPALTTRRPGEAGAEAMAGPSSEGPRQRNTTESTPIAPSAHESRDYASICPAQSRDATHLSNATSDPAAPQEGTAGALDRGAPQARMHSAERLADATERREASRWTQLWENWGSVELENKGSVARDHLALERTFLAWLRTSLSFASIGIAITQLFRLNSSLRSDSSPSSSSTGTETATGTNAHSLYKLRHLGKPLGATFIAISILMLFIGFHRYFEAQHYVIRGKFPASRGSIVVVSLVAGGLIVSSLVVILATSPSVFES